MKVNRRSFLTGLATISVGATSYTYLNQDDYTISKLYQIDERPVHIEKISKNKFNFSFIQTNNSDKLLITQNKYGDKSNIIKKKKIPIEKTDQIRELSVEITPKKTTNYFVYSIYRKENDNWIFIGETDRLQFKNNKIQVIDYFKQSEKSHKKENDNYQITNNNGYLRIRYNHSDYSSCSFYISKQYLYNNSSMTYRFGKAVDKYVSNNVFSKYIINQLESQITFDSKAEKINYIINLVQHLNYKPDRESGDTVGNQKAPVRVFCNLQGDCSDQVILLNSLITSGLEIETSIVFTKLHAFSGIKIDSLTDEFKESSYLDTTKHNHAVIEFNNHTFICIETTNEEIAREDFMSTAHTVLYNNSYYPINPKNFIKHSYHSIKYMLTREEPF